MVSFQGTFQIFDDQSFLSYDSIYGTKTIVKSYPPESLMGYIHQYHPKFGYIIQLAKLDWQMADPSFRGTLFIPVESSIDERQLLSMDINTARKIVKYHLMIGFFPKKSLETSPYQQLQTSIKSSTIVAFWNVSTLYLNINETYVVEFDIIASNGLLHKINQSMISF